MQRVKGLFHVLDLLADSEDLRFIHPHPRCSVKEICQISRTQQKGVSPLGREVADPEAIYNRLEGFKPAYELRLSMVGASVGCVGDPPQFL